VASWENSVVRENDGRKLDHRTLEVLRMRAIEQVAAGAHPEEVAVTMGFHNGVSPFLWTRDQAAI
jgi:hypothetical protein